MKLSFAIVLSVVVIAGVIAASQIGAQTTAPPAALTTTAPAASVPVATVQDIVEITRAVPAGATAVEAFTVPAGGMLVVTDIIVTNTSMAAACGGAVNRGGAPGAAAAPASTVTPSMTSTSPTVTAPSTLTTPTASTVGPTQATAPVAPSPTAAPAVTTSVGTLTQTDSTVTGPLCVPAQTSTALPLTTGIEFASGQIVQLLNAPSPTGVPGSLAFHLRGLLINQG